MISVPQALDTAWKYYQAGQMQQAEQLYLQILQEDPNQIDALHLVGVIAGQTGRYDLAADYLKTTVRLKPDFAAAHNNLGNVFILQRKFEEAVDSFRQAAHSSPDFAVAHCNLGNALRELGRLDEAVASLQEALRLKPNYTEAHDNLAIALQAQGKLGEAVASLQHVLRLRPNYMAHFNLGVALWKQGRLDEAVASFQQAVRLKPDSVEAHFALGVALEKQWQLEEAVASYQQAVNLNPDYMEARVNLGNSLKDQGRLDEAIAAYRRALELRPEEALIHSNLIFALNYHPGYDSAAILEECRRWDQQHAQPLRKSILPHGNLRDPERRLRIGYVSADFCDHVDSYFMIPLLSNHDHRQFEIFCYASVPRPDAITQRLRCYADVWRSTVGLSDEELAELVRSDQIDILVDLEMHVANNRLLMFARKPAPVQVAWLGYPGTTGLSAIDYRLTDPYLDPPGLFDVFYAEVSVRLPETFWCYGPLTNQPPVNSLPALLNSVITLGCLNNFCKINDWCLALWADVLQAVPRSRLLLLAPSGEARERVSARFQEKGINLARIEFVDRVPRQEYLKLYHRIDLGLDPLPYNGHTTSLDAFWMGVPVLTLLGKTVVGRAGWSQLCNLGLQELAAETPEQFVALAARVAADLPRLQELRATLRERMEQSPLMDGKRFARNVEQAFRQMWRRWCQQERPQEVSKAIAPDQPISGPNDIAGISLPQALDLAWKHFQAGRLNQAEQLYRQILDADANQVDALHLLGVIAGQTGRNDLAVKYLDAALCLKPDLAQAHSNRGIALAGQGKLAEAEASFVRALCLKPDFADAHVNLGHAVRDQGRLDDALDAYLAALALKPDSPYIHSSLIGVLNYHPGYDAAAIHEECRRWNQRYAEPLNKLILPHANPPDPERRLRVGYVSPDFREHVDSFFTVPLLSNHDHRQYEICCYADVAFPDALTERLRGFADLWRSTVGLSDQQVADIIRADQIDILVDLEMHLANNRLLMFARKPAPVQVCWLGCPGGTGLSAMDYRLTDPYLDPPGLFDGFYSEESIRLPDTFWCYDPLTDQPPVNALPALANGVITFGCLNNFCKINDGVLALWAKVLQAVPQSRLLMLAPQGQPREHVLLRLKQNGIDSARVDFVHKRRRLEYLQLYQRIDLGLDPLPYNGHTTSLDGFWMGVPTLTLLGKTVVGRAGWSQLCNLGLQELAAQTPEQFVALAARVAADLPRLQELRATLRQRMQQSPLMDGKRFARHMEQAYRQMWRRWCGQRSNRT